MTPPSTTPPMIAAASSIPWFIKVIGIGTGLSSIVGILVDDATVTIENINRHVEEHGEDILTAITRGAQEIMPPATIALFCICIAFVPLLALGGVAGYLFRPLAMAVVFAMIASYILTYTLVQTMAHFLLANQHRHSTRGASGEPFPVGLFGVVSEQILGLSRLC
jgi:multidrug efflux pump subunit AcrB